MQVCHTNLLVHLLARSSAQRHEYLAARVQRSREQQDVEAFDSPIVELEQYPTGVEIAARMLYTVNP